ncbi:MAG TPA: C1 family peptidase [Solirubrobacteraceae bacterium]|nr:C1 family peptidase [Solirubrobacteraceae bacterium]
MTDFLTSAGLTPRKIHRYGWKPSLPDARDHIADTSELAVLDEVDPRADLPDVFDQGQLGSCTANAVAAAVEYDAKLNAADPGFLSRLWIYYYERKLEGAPADQDTGAYGRDGLKVCQKLGVPLEADWPYDISKFADEPPESLDKEAGEHRISNYRAVPRNLDSMRAVLSNRQTIAFGFSVYESFESQQVAQTGIVPLPTRNEKQLGGHEVLMVGYLKDQSNYALVRNSWGTGWGIKGYFLMPWAYILDANLASDFRTIRRPAGK